MHSVLLRGCGKRGEIHVGGDVLFSGSFVRVGAHGVLAKCCECAAMASGELFLASVSVVDGDEDATILAEAICAMDCCAIKGTSIRSSASGWTL